MVVDNMIKLAHVFLFRIESSPHVTYYKQNMICVQFCCLVWGVHACAPEKLLLSPKEAAADPLPKQQVQRSLQLILYQNSSCLWLE